MSAVDFNVRVGQVIGVVSKKSNIYHYSCLKIIAYDKVAEIVVSLPQQGLTVALGDSLVLRIKTPNGYSSHICQLVGLGDQYGASMRLRLPVGARNQRKQLQRSPRLVCAAPILRLTMQDGDVQRKVTMLDVNHGGARLLCAQRLGQIGEKFCIDIKAPDSDRLLTLSCAIRYVRNDLAETGQHELHYHHGIEFSNVSEETSYFLARFSGDIPYLNHSI